jgi:undecaprenyl-diphosphatase
LNLEILNKEIFLYINSFADTNSFLDFLGIFFAKFMPHIFFAIVIFLYFFNNRKTEFLFTLYSGILALLFNKTVGLFFYHNRPFADGLGIKLISHRVDSSFPSDHATFLIAAAIIYILFNLKSKAGWLLFSLATLCGFSRVYCGVHYPFDIFGSAIVALLASSVIYKFKKNICLFHGIIQKIGTRVFINVGNYGFLNKHDSRYFTK